MANIGSRKQITFDLCQEALKKYYPHSLTQAYYDIRRFMESHGFEHRQSSAYVSLDKMTTLDVVSLAEQLAMALPWLSRCVNEIDVANIGVQHSLKKVLENASRPLSVELEALPLEAAAPRPTHSGHLHAGKRHSRHQRQRMLRHFSAARRGAGHERRRRHERHPVVRRAVRHALLQFGAS